MSYSFSVRAANREDAKAQVAGKLAEVLAQQPSHAADMPMAQNTANAFIDVLAEDPAKDVLVNMNGSLSWEWIDGSATKITGANVNVSAWLTQKQ